MGEVKEREGGVEGDVTKRDEGKRLMRKSG